IRIISEIRPRAIMIENVRGLLDAIFDDFRNHFQAQVEDLGYAADCNILNASDFGVAQLRPRVVFVAMRRVVGAAFRWATGGSENRRTVGDLLKPLMAAQGWKDAENWALKANEIAPTLVGGSHKHGGADLGPTRAKQAWKQLGVDGMGLADG